MFEKVKFDLVFWDINLRNFVFNLKKKLTLIFTFTNTLQIQIFLYH